MEVVIDCAKALEGDCPRLSSQIKIDHPAGTYGRVKLIMAAVKIILL